MSLKMSTTFALDSLPLPLATVAIGIPTSSRLTSPATRASTRAVCFAGGEANNQLKRREALVQFVILPATCLVASGGAVLRGLPSCAAEDRPYIQEVKDTIIKDITQGQYYVTGNLTRSIYDENCRFSDPTTVVSGVDKYVAAIQFLFDPRLSQHELLAIEISSPSTIDVKWRLAGYLKFPWNPRIRPYEGSTRYTVNNKGLIVSHDETWDISLWTAFLEFITPSWKIPM